MRLVVLEFLEAARRTEITHAIERDSPPAARVSAYYVLSNLIRERYNQRAG
ncbi:MAG: hypothetical protein WCA85_13905 [Paraburkholderia sp.]|uniref:hypothetical protein n=1 Tax=Paraburkholderia sp. TaxID=1926495 RepID=UPI003C4DF339